MMFAFSRDGAVPGARLWSKVNAQPGARQRRLASAIIGVLIITLPALFKVDSTGLPVAFYAVVSIGVIGLYVAFAIPIYLRWRAGDSLRAGHWNLGNKYKWIAPLAVIEIVDHLDHFLLPTLPGLACRGNDGLHLGPVNYTPIVVFGVLIAITIWWAVSAKNWFKGPKTTIDLPAGRLVVRRDRRRARTVRTCTGAGHAPPAYASSSEPSDSPEWARPAVARAPLARVRAHPVVPDVGSMAGVAACASIAP